MLKQKPQRYLSVTGIILTCLLLLHLSLTAGYFLVRPPVIEEVRPAIRYIGDHIKDSDMLYVNTEAGLAMKYYGKRYGLEHTNYIEGEMNLSTIDRLTGHERVWIMFSHIFLYLVISGRLIAGQSVHYQECFCTILPMDIHPVSSF